MGTVERSSQFSLSFWFSVDNGMFNQVYPNLQRNGKVGKSGKIMLMSVLNPKRPMNLDERGEYLHQGHPPCPISKIELLKDTSLFEKENIRSNPNCFTNGLEDMVKFKRNNSPNGVQVKIMILN